MEPEASKLQLRVLHLRFSGPEKIHRDIKKEIEALLYERHTKSMSLPLMKDYDEYSALIGDCFDFLLPRDYSLPETTLKPTSPCEAEEFLAFAEWAFGPSGLPNLYVLAFGDFSHEDRYPSQQFLVRRVDFAECRPKEVGRSALEEISGPSFCSADLTDPCVWNDVSVDGAQFLGACPGGGLMESPYDF